jgi:hypothetical protein
MVKHLHSMNETLGSIPKTIGKKKNLLERVMSWKWIQP